MSLKNLDLYKEFIIFNNKFLLHSADNLND